MIPTSKDATVRVRNLAETPFIDHYQGQRFVVPANGEALIPWGAACIWFGNPSILNNGPNKMRSAEWNHLMSRYSVYYHNDRKHLLPQCEIYSLTVDGTGTPERIYMVLDDPTGERAIGAPDTSAAASETDILRSQVLEMQRNQMALLNILQAMNPEAFAQLQQQLAESAVKSVGGAQPAPQAPDAPPGGHDADSPGGATVPPAPPSPAPSEPAAATPVIPLPEPPPGTTVGGVPVSGAAPVDGPNRAIFG